MSTNGLNPGPGVEPEPVAADCECRLSPRPVCCGGVSDAGRSNGGMCTSSRPPERLTKSFKARFDARGSDVCGPAADLWSPEQPSTKPETKTPRSKNFFMSPPE